MRKNLQIELHPEKSRIIPLSRGIDFVGFRNFYYFRLLRTRNVRSMKNKIRDFINGKKSYEKLFESFQGWQAYARWADSYNLIKSIINCVGSLF